MGAKLGVSCIRNKVGGWHAREEQGEQRFLFLGLASLLYCEEGESGFPWRELNSRRGDESVEDA